MSKHFETMSDEELMDAYMELICCNDGLTYAQALKQDEILCEISDEIQARKEVKEEA